MLRIHVPNRPENRDPVVITGIGIITSVGSRPRIHLERDLARTVRGPAGPGGRWRAGAPGAGRGRRLGASACRSS